MTNQLRSWLLLALCAVLSLSTIHAQQMVKISLLKDGNAEEYDDAIQNELDALLGNEYQLDFTIVDLDGLSAAGGLDAIYANSDIVISTGFNITYIVASQKNFSKPTILPFVFDQAMQNIPASVDGTSGVKNFTYVESPFDLKRDFETMYKLYPYKSIALVGDNAVDRNDRVQSYLKSLLPVGIKYDLLNMTSNADEMLTKLQDYDAVYFFPLESISDNDTFEKTVGKLSDEGKITFSLISEPYLDQGVYGSHETDDNFQRVPRRVALNVMKILEGRPASELSVEMNTYSDDLLLNMAAVNRTGIYPSYEMMNSSIIKNLTLEDGNESNLNLQLAIAEALKNNLQLSIAEHQVAMGEKDISIAKSNLLPQLDGSASVYQLDEGRTIFQGQGTLGAYNLNAAVDLTQVILSEPAMAYITIQKLLNESNKYALEQNQLDVVQNVTNAYIGILQTQALVELNNENLNVTRQNYNIAKNKESIGQSGVSDVYRWESQQALQNVEVNNAMAQLAQARHALNFLLNRPTAQVSNLEDLVADDMGILVNDLRYMKDLNNRKQVMKLADFLALEARENLPEVKQIEASIKATERNLVSQKRAYYLPQIALTGNLTQPLGHYDVPESVMRVDDVPRQYQVAVGVQLPIFKGFSRRHNQAKTEVQLLQLADNKELLQDNLELNVRNAVTQAGASYRNRELTKIAAEAAAKNFDIAQHSYNEGILNITSLIDAQNALLQANINATNAEYTFVRDFIALERTYGKYYFLMSPSEQDAFYERFVEFFTRG